jgi:hypothetical protein
MTCNHKKTQMFLKDVTIFVLLIFLFFVLREIFAWYFKSNTVLAAIKENNTILLTIQDMLESLTQ